VEIDRTKLSQLLHTQGDNDTADRLDAAGLPDTLDTDRDGDALAGIGLDQQTLLGHLAGGAIGGNLAM
jgi:hypothetical protein